jgi:hypothetical protein
MQLLHIKIKNIAWFLVVLFGGTDSNDQNVVVVELVDNLRA